MPTDIILSKVPFPHGNSETIIMRVEDPTKLTWESIFTFIENRTNMPRCIIAGTDSNGKYIYGKCTEYPPWIYNNYRLSEVNGTKIASAFICIHSTPWFCN
jgi:hypothetical protein